jgi:hypothetical protein
MRRFVVIVTTMTVFALLAFPVASSAAGWVVKNPAGSRMGKVVRTAKREATVYDKSGRRCGYVQWSDGAYRVAKGYDWDTGVRKYASLNYSIGAWWIVSDFRPGVCTKRNGRWRVTNTTSGRFCGSISGRSPGWAAAGAVFVLSRYLK